MRRAAELSEPASRSRRLLAAAGLAVELGRPDVVEPLLREVEQLDLGDAGRARVAWVEETALTRPLDDCAVRVADRRRGAGRSGRRPRPARRSALARRLARLVGRSRVPRRGRRSSTPRAGSETRTPRTRACSRSTRTPIRSATRPGSSARLRGAAATSESTPTPPASSARPRSSSAPSTWATTSSPRRSTGCGREGRLGHLPRLLTLYSSMAARIGDWDVAITAADEARRLARSSRSRSGRPRPTRRSRSSRRCAATRRRPSAMAARAEMVAEPVGANITIAFAQFGKVLAALASGRHADAYASPNRLFDPADSAYHPVISSWLIADLAEAARHIDRLDAARARVAQVEASVGERPGTWIALDAPPCPRAARGAGARRASASRRRSAATSTRWPFQRARLLLAYGQWLRRQRRVAESRAVAARGARHLRRARLRAVERAGAPRAARIRRAQPAPRPRGARPADRAGAADRAARGGRAVEPRDRPAAVPLAPHDQHAPVPGVPEARDHVARRAERRAGAAATYVRTYAAPRRVVI